MTNTKKRQKYKHKDKHKDRYTHTNTKYTITKRSERKKSNVPISPPNFWGTKFVFGKKMISWLPEVRFRSPKKGKSSEFNSRDDA